MQSKVIDINSAVTVYRTNLIRAIENQDRHMAEVSIFGLNSLLDPVNAMIFDDRGYQDEAKGTKYVKCQKCEKTTEYEPNVIKSSGYHRLSGERWDSEYVVCNQKSCGVKIPVNSYHDLITVKKTTEKCQYLPEKPKILDNCSESLNIGRFWSWALVCSTGLERAHALQRIEISNQEDF